MGRGEREGGGLRAALSSTAPTAPRVTTEKALEMWLVRIQLCPKCKIHIRLQRLSREKK